MKKINRWMLIMAGIVGLIGFVYFYDFKKEGHALKIENHSESNITILKMFNDDKEIILPRGKRTLEPKPLNGEYTAHWSEGGCDIVTSGRYKPGTLHITVQNAFGEIKTASCILKRSAMSTREFIIKYHGNEELSCTNEYLEESACNSPDPREGIQIIDKEITDHLRNYK